MATRYIKLELCGLSECESHVMRAAITKLLNKYALVDKAVLCVEEENEDGLFEPVESECINAFEPDGTTNDWMNAKVFRPSNEADDHSNFGLM